MFMLGKKGKFGIGHKKNELHNTVQTAVTIDALRYLVANMDDAEIIERQTNKAQKVTLVYIRTLIDQERLNETIIEPLTRCYHDAVYECIASSKVSEITTLDEAQTQLMLGSILLSDSLQN
jgi:predicted transcriptional regulator